MFWRIRSCKRTESPSTILSISSCSLICRKIPALPISAPLLGGLSQPWFVSWWSRDSQWSLEYQSITRREWTWITSGAKKPKWTWSLAPNLREAIPTLLVTTLGSCFGEREETKLSDPVHGPGGDEREVKRTIQEALGGEKKIISHAALTPWNQRRGERQQSGTWPGTSRAARKGNSCPFSVRSTQTEHVSLTCPVQGLTS